jgi:glycine/D-amino acid oxidase-like deaminating enzyme
MTTSFDAIVVGGGLLGSAIGFGLARIGLATAVLDEGDIAYRAARGNFGLVWVQSKGIGKPVYANWTMHSADLWPGFALELRERTGIDVVHSRKGGVHICLSEAEFDARAERMATLQGHQGDRFSYEMLDRKALQGLLPGLGPEVVGGSYTSHDGHANPLYLLRALQQGLVGLGGRLMPGCRVQRIERTGAAFWVRTGRDTLVAPRIVLAAGLGNRELAPLVGLDQPVHPVKGQILVSERARPFLDLPTTHVRQTGEGTVLIGDSHEDVGFDVRSTPRVGKTIADRARRTFPFLSRARVVRTWAALRVMTPDGLPIYDQSETAPGAFAVSCHSGVTLAAAHALRFASYVSEGWLGEEISALSARRFDV